MLVLLVFCTVIVVVSFEFVSSCCASVFVLLSVTIVDSLVPVRCRCLFTLSLPPTADFVPPRFHQFRETTFVNPFVESIGGFSIQLLLSRRPDHQSLIFRPPRIPPLLHPGSVTFYTGSLNDTNLLFLHVLGFSKAT